MLNRYEKFLVEFDKMLDEFSKTQTKYLKCQKGCADCCKNGDYPFSRLEMEYFMAGFQDLSKDVKDKILENINNAKGKKVYQCPFLIDNLCSMYNRRSLTCRIHGLAYLSNGVIKLPECANFGKNYSEYYNPETKEIQIENPIDTSLRVDDIFNSKLAQDFNLQSGEIRSLIDWFK